MVMLPAALYDAFVDPGASMTWLPPRGMARRASSLDNLAREMGS